MELDIAALLTEQQRTELTTSARATFTAAAGDSNDAEIQALQDFRDLALQALDLDLDQSEEAD